MAKFARASRVVRSHARGRREDIVPGARVHLASASRARRPRGRRARVAAGEDTFPTGAGVDLDDAKTRAVAMAMTPERFGKITLTGPGRGTEARAYRRVEFRCVRVRRAQAAANAIRRATGVYE